MKRLSSRLNSYGKVTNGRGAGNASFGKGSSREHEIGVPRGMLRLGEVEESELSREIDGFTSPIWSRIALETNCIVS